jgi:hypothetical protein
VLLIEKFKTLINHKIMATWINSEWLFLWRRSTKKALLLGGEEQGKISGHSRGMEQRL